MIIKWKTLTTHAKQAFDEKSYKQSIELGWQALDYARVQFSSEFADNPDGAIAMVMVSYFNLIDNYEAIGEPLMCENLFDDSFAFFKQINPPVDNEYHQIGVMRGLNLWQKNRTEYLNRVSMM